jgi:membrane protein YdbS with pleckstrin-like domain
MPEVADGREHSLDAASVQAARITGGVAAAVFSGAGIIATVVLLLSVGPGVPMLLLGLLLSGVLPVTLIGLALGWPGVSHRYISYRVDAQGLRIRRGVWWRSEISLPRSRVQHTDVSRGPIERGFDLATLIVHTAGTENASVSLGGLKAAQAYAIRDYLIGGGEDDAV